MQPPQSASDATPLRASESPRIDWFTPARFAALLALLTFAAFPQVVLGLQTFVVRDFGFFAYPLAYYQHECFWRGQLPLWNPYNSCGVPFLAQFNTMVLYPPALIYLLLPLPWSLSFFCLIHLWFAGLGAYFLARRWTGNNFAAAFAGVAFAFNGLTLNLLMWPSHIATFAWTPWVVLAVERAWREGGRTMLLAACAGAIQMLAGGPEPILFTWLLLAAIWIVELVRGSEACEKPTPRWAKLWRFPFLVLLVGALTAAQLLPFLDLVAHSERAPGFADTRWAMPAWGWVNYLVPLAFGKIWDMGVFFQYHQQWTSSYFLGTGTLMLALLAVWTLRERRVWLLGATGIVALLFAFGDQTFVIRWLRRAIPQLTMTTYPIKYVLLITFVTPMLAAFALARLQNGRTEVGSSSLPDAVRIERRLKLLTVLLLALIAGILVWVWRFPFPTDDVRATLINGLTRAVFLMVSAGLVIAVARTQRSAGLQPIDPTEQPAPSSPARRMALRWLPLGLLCVAWLDVLTHEPNQNPTVAPWIFTPGLARTRLAMHPQPALGQSRAMVAASANKKFVEFSMASLKQNFIVKRLGYFADCNLLDGVPKVNGFFSLHPLESDELNQVLYRATNASFNGLFDFLGVSQITAPGQFFKWEARTNFLPLVTAGQRPVFLDDPHALWSLVTPHFDGSKIVFLPPAAKSLVTATNQTVAQLSDRRFTTQRVDVDVNAESASLVVVAQTYYPRWRAYVDNKPVPLLRADYAFQAVEVPAGKHHVRLSYEDRSFHIGALISGLSLLVCVAACFRQKSLVHRNQN